MALEACRSLASLGLPSFKVVLVDNYSTEENRRLAQNGVNVLGRDFFFLGLPENRGYGPGNNAGLRKLFGEFAVGFAFVVNSDIVVRGFDFESLPSIPRGDAIYGVTLIENGRSRIGASWFSPRSFRRKDLVHGAEMHSRRGGVVYASGCFWGLSRSLFVNSGGFSEEYFLYFEELDFVYAYRSRHGRFPHLVLLPGIVAEHRHGGTTGISSRPQSRSLVAEYYSARSRMVFARKWNRPFLASACVYNGLLALRAAGLGRLDLTRAIGRATWSGLFSTPPLP